MLNIMEKEVELTIKNFKEKESEKGRKVQQQK